MVIVVVKDEHVKHMQSAWPPLSPDTSWILVTTPSRVELLPGTPGYDATLWSSGHHFHEHLLTSQTWLYLHVASSETFMTAAQYYMYVRACTLMVNCRSSPRLFPLIMTVPHFMEQWIELYQTGRDEMPLQEGRI